jgi:hypothetical protein
METGESAASASSYESRGHGLDHARSACVSEQKEGGRK